jgi:hypothetical protein
MNPHSSAVERAMTIAAGIPEGGLFHEKTWRVSPEPLPLSPALCERLDRLGRHLARFVEACSRLDRMSRDGRQPAWIAELLDRGKPRWLVELQNQKPLSTALPKVLRPDLILHGDRFTIAEIDSVPGGIGLTDWLALTYTSQGTPVLGGPDGMLDGFASIFPGGDIVISEESATYRPEMRWLATRLNAKFPESHWRVTEVPEPKSASIYRFFEMFDVANIPGAADMVRSAASGKIEMTPPPRPALEEKLWFALFWLRPLEPFWLRALGGRTLRFLRECIPTTWLLDPSPLPPHAAIPGLDVHSWEEVNSFSQKERELILKISGFSENAWGSRGVVLGSDLSASAWRDALHAALEAWPTSPHILQKFHPGGLVEHPCLNGNSIQSMRGRVRLCPYYFVQAPARVSFGGAFATICPDDKKLLHGMSDAILVPSTLALQEP